MSLFKRLAVALALALTPVVATAAPEVTPLVSTGWLSDHLGRDDVVILDIRSPIAKSGKDDYVKGHIPGAVWSEYPGFWRSERDGIEGALPSIEKLEASLSDLGVSEGKAVVIVPAGTSSLEFGAAARIYWTLKYLGHDAVAILDGGHKAWSEEERALETGEVVPTGDLFVAEPRPELLASTEQVAAKLNGAATLLDARPLAQFSGKDKHKKALAAGHIPGAVHLDQDVFYDAQANRLKSTGALAALVPAAVQQKAADIVSYCNTGHWAATNWFVLSELLGRKNVSLYVDSMVGWTRQSGLPISLPTN
ncbi:sulfurtransferase [Polymorphum gilvum]|uniref:Rhodanese-like domain protein n=1 Tax=Polymorphum gilvum (strain LMG 25793 / CGMCC 1.9160 / SL003B-26A1) TaxID=991905 RepID=F2J5Z3_POLGS|nr:rhodanese-like domain-containing protein [Polymorphum gilvum]ADZ71247.1 Rhodanese-like domain protein [Polymorphum gilvum SL003B-26A1]